MKVIAAPGTRCPREEQSGPSTPVKFITDSEAVDVPDTTYYRRLVNDGSLIISPSHQPSPETGEGTNNPSPSLGEGKGEGITQEEVSHE